jgi:hypothetical protein
VTFEASCEVHRLPCQRQHRDIGADERVDDLVVVLVDESDGPAKSLCLVASRLVHRPLPPWWIVDGLA